MPAFHFEPKQLFKKAELGWRKEGIRKAPTAGCHHKEGLTPPRAAQLSAANGRRAGPHGNGTAAPPVAYRRHRAPHKRGSVASESSLSAPARLRSPTVSIPHPNEPFLRTIPWHRVLRPRNIPWVVRIFCSDCRTHGTASNQQSALIVRAPMAHLTPMGIQCQSLQVQCFRLFRCISCTRK